jgi:hypothetical protein
MVMSDFDSPWKEALDRFFRAFLEFFFPAVAQGIDWSKNYEVLDKELEQIVREGDTGNRLADKLFKVWLTSGRPLWILIHVEVQSQKQEEFAERMFVYHYRIYDRFRQPVLSLAVLGDEHDNWRPDEFRYAIFGGEMVLKFPIVKLLDYAKLMPVLETDANPFALVVMAHLQSLATRGDPDERYIWKIRLTRALLDRGTDGEKIRLLFKFIDWMMDLPDELARQFEYQMYEYEKEKKMPYITSIERHALAKGREEGQIEERKQTVLEFLEGKFGPLSPKARETIDSWSYEKLKEITKTLGKTTSLQELGLDG